MKEKLSNGHLTKPLLSLLQENHEKMLLQEICHTPILYIYTGEKCNFEQGNSNPIAQSRRTKHPNA